jgi:hypothetical protein
MHAPGLRRAAEEAKLRLPLRPRSYVARLERSVHRDQPRAPETDSG